MADNEYLRTVVDGLVCDMDNVKSSLAELYRRTEERDPSIENLEIDVNNNRTLSYRLESEIIHNTLLISELNLLRVTLLFNLSITIFLTPPSSNFFPHTNTNLGAEKFISFLVDTTLCLLFSFKMLTIFLI